MGNPVENMFNKIKRDSTPANEEIRMSSSDASGEKNTSGVKFEDLKKGKTSAELLTDLDRDIAAASNEK
jgi:hypothetical protein